MRVANLPLREICTIQGGGTPSRKHTEFYGGNIPWLTVKDLKVHDLVGAQESITDAGVTNSATRVLPPNTVIVATRITVGAVGIARVPVAINQDLKGLTVRQDVSPEYLAWFLRTKKPTLESKASGSTVKGITTNVLAGLIIPLPPLEEQRRVVGLLDRTAEIRRRADAARAKARAIIPALFLDMFGDPATNPMGWAIQSLVELADIGSGLTKGRKLNGTPTMPTPYLRVANVQADRLDLSEIKLIDATEDDRQRCRLVVGDLLMTEGGDIDKLGRCAMWRGEVDLCLHQNHVFRVRMGKSVSPDYARAFMQSDAARGYFLRVAKRTTGIASINKTQLGQLPVWVPPLSLQTAFAEQAQRIEATARTLDAAAAKAEAMAASLSSEIFS